MRYISVADFLERLDPAIIFIGVSAIFIKSSMFFFACCYGIARWIGIKNWRNTIWFAAPIVLLLGMIPRNSVETFLDIPRKFSFTLLFPIAVIGIPLLLWIVATIRKSRNVQHRRLGS